MNLRSLAITATFVSGVVVCPVYAGPINPIAVTAGQFGPPISETQTGPQCSTPGSKFDQYHMQWNTDINPSTGLPINKYHIGEDWNGKCTGSADAGYPLLAISDGQVVYIDSVGSTAKGKQLHIRYSFPYSFGQNGLQTFDSVYLHISGVNPNEVTWSGPGTGSTVTRGDVVAYLGGTGGWTPHLHWEAVWDNDSSLLTANSYQNPLTKTHALRYRAPSLIVDDHRDIRQYSLANNVGSWYIITMQGNAPSSTAYVSRNGQNKSLKNAIAAGWISSEGMLFEAPDGWRYYYNVDANFFESGKRYAIRALVSGVSLNIPVPRNGFQQDRARLDMIRAIENNTAFLEVRTETYGRNPNWSTDFEIHWMAFKLFGGGTAYVNTAVNKINPLIRYTAYQDPVTFAWSPWQQVDRNRLY